MKDIHGRTTARLHRLQGQLRGIERLIDLNRPLPAVLQQLQAADSALRSLITTLLEDRLDRFEGDEIKLSPDEAEWIKRLLR